MKTSKVPFLRPAINLKGAKMFKQHMIG